MKNVSARREMSTIFQGNLARSIVFGHALEIGARAQEKAQRFRICLCNNKLNKNANTDIGFLLIADLNRNKIILNQRINNEWQTENAKNFTTEIFKTDFRINIIVAESKFHIAINNRAIISYKYERRLPQLDRIEIEGDLECVKQIDHRQYFPETWPLIQITENKLDFSNDQPMSFKPGHIVIISARLYGSENGKFMIQLRNARNNKRPEFYASFRFHTKEFLRNCKIIQGDILVFDDEEIEGYFPFEDFFKPFKIALAFTESEIKIAKDGEIICDYCYRTANVLPDIVGVKIFGIDGVKVRVSAIDHVQLNNSQCLRFENYSIIK